MARYHYGAPEDYDEWARIAGPGAEHWAYKEMNKYAALIVANRVFIGHGHRYFIKFEHFHPSKAHPDVDSTLRGSDGPVDSELLLL